MIAHFIGNGILAHGQLVRFEDNGDPSLSKVWIRNASIHQFGRWEDHGPFDEWMFLNALIGADHPT